MSKRKLASATLTQASIPAVSAVQTDETYRGDAPINIINDRLDQAHATLDLISTAVEEGGELFIETLNPRTLATALYGAMLRIEEAKEVASEWHSRERGCHE